MALSMFGLFAVTPPIAPLLWFALTLALLFSGFSFLTISFYAQGVTKAANLGEGGHVRLAGWRETGALLGVSLAAVAPVLLIASDAPFTVFASAFALITVIAIIAMRNEWDASKVKTDSGFRVILADPLAKRLLLIALVNAMPVAVSSTLFLFFVERRLEAPGWEGPLLLLFFLAAACSAPLWSRIALIIGPKSTLFAAMILALAAFSGALLLGPGDVTPFLVICIASGFAMGADLTLLPALFAARAAEVSPEASSGFGLWSFVSKLSLAFAAVALLPLLEASGFTTGSDPLTDQAAFTLTAMYAGLPCALKLVALTLLATTSLNEDATSPNMKEA